MKNNNISESKFIKFLNGKTFYVVSAFCLLAIGIAAWSAFAAYQNFLVVENDNNSSNVEIKQNVSSILEKIQQEAKVSSEMPTSSKQPSSQSASSKSNTSKISSSQNVEQTDASIFIMPASGEIIKDFGDNQLIYSLTYNDFRVHNGIDIAVSEGNRVYASATGTVTNVYKDPLFGTVVEIDHGNGITARYCGLNELTVIANGKQVDSSVVIGTVDKIPCESVEQYHLHLEFLKDGKYVSPLTIINR